MKTSFLPITAKEVQERGWQEVDIVIISGDAYVDHPGFGHAVIGRVLEREGYKVALLPQPNWQDDLRDFKKFGKPRLFFGITSGCMDSMVNHYTAAKRLRSNDAYTPGGQSGFRPDRAAYVYSKIVKELYPDVPIVIGGIEASMRRFTHYDYWDDALRAPFLSQAPADVMVYGMGEKTIVEVARLLDVDNKDGIKNLPQVAYLSKDIPQNDNWSTIVLESHEKCLKDKRIQAKNFGIIELESNKIEASRLVQSVGKNYVIVNPPHLPYSSEELDSYFSLPYMRMPHPKYLKRGVIPAYEMIKFSVNIHRGCFGGCSFCTISAHQGKQVVSRSCESVLEEVKKISSMSDFKGVLSDLGGPSANMYMMKGKNTDLCKKCSRYSCIHPTHCKNLESSHKPLLDLYAKVEALPNVRHVYIGSGIRYDLFTPVNGGKEYFKRVVSRHVSGRLKVAPEHTSEKVLSFMRKPSFQLFIKIKKEFDIICKENGINRQLIPYFISSHPSCTISDMAELAVIMKDMGYKLEQIQDFTPTPMTLSTEMYYTGYNPATMEKVFVPRHPNEKKEQNTMFFWYKPECRAAIKNILMKSNNKMYIQKLFGRR
jgi:uncharacterized radical SAM protein YgiQ